MIRPEELAAKLQLMFSEEMDKLSTRTESLEKTVIKLQKENDELKKSLENMNNCLVNIDRRTTPLMRFGGSSNHGAS